MRISDWSSDVCSSDLDHRDCPWIFPDRLFRTGILTTEFRVRSEDGFRTVSCRGSSFLGDGGMQRMIGMEIDVTQEHQTKDELTRIYSLLSDETAKIRRDRERLFELTADLMAVGTAAGTLLRWEDLLVGKE